MGLVSIEKQAHHKFLDALYSLREKLKPPPKLTLSQWSNEYAVLSKETSSQTGRFQSYKYQDGIMDAITDPANEYITMMKSARVGYTRIVDNAIGYYIHQDPSPMMVVQPRVEDAEDYSKTEIAPMLRDTPVLAELTPPEKSKSSGQTILKKKFLNSAILSMIGANSPGGFRRVTIRVLFFDEVDAYPVGGAGSEGDQIALGIKRTETFWNRKIVMGSTPTIKGISRIEKSYLESDQRKYFVPCPHCGAYQVLEWGGKDVPYGIKWHKDENGEGLPETTYYACRHNGCVIEHHSLAWMVENGEWRATAPAPFKGHAGFHIWAGYSLFPNAAWPKLVEEWLKVKNDPLRRQTFYNTTLGEPYEDFGEFALSENRLLERCEVWDTEVPDGVAVLTAGIDTQDDRFEIEVKGWGANEENWSIAFDIIEGDLETPEPWERLDAYLQQVWRRADGRGFTISAACMDSGGHHTQQVYKFCKERLGRRIWAIKGESAQGGKRSPVWPVKRITQRNRVNFRPIIIGVNAAKDSIRHRLNLTLPESGAAPGYMHFPVQRDLHYFSQLLAEKLTIKESGGQKYRVWELRPGRANEALDCNVYSYAALCGLLHHGLKLNIRAATLEQSPESLLPPPDKPEKKIDFRLAGVEIPQNEEKTKPLSMRLPR